MTDSPRITLVCLHFLGGSAREWDAVAACLEPDMDILAIDLPGFGAAAAIPGYTVAEMADHVAHQVSGLRAWVLAGHSMGAKVASVLARRAEDGDASLQGLAGLALLAGSPPCPEPMQESKREEMLGWFAGSPDECRREAGHYIRANLGAPLETDVHEAVVDAMLPGRRDAWIAWLTQGSREDWAGRVGVLRTPALVLAGTEDTDLGMAAQERHMLPHLADAEAVSVPGAGHLLPLERATVVARLIASRFAAPQPVPPEYRALIDSHRVSTGTRRALLDRAEAPAPAHTLSPADRGTLRAVVDRAVPQSGPARIDIANRLADALPGPGDGWREAGLPPDPEAWPRGLRTLEAIAHGFAGRDVEDQEAVMRRVAAGRGGGHTAGLLDAKQMKGWFEDLRAEATRHYIAHPATFARLRYSGIGYGGDGPDKPGFTQIGIGQREAWEPA